MNYFNQRTWQISLEHLQILAEQSPSLAPETSKYVQFSEFIDPQPTVTIIYIKKYISNRINSDWSTYTIPSGGASWRFWLSILDGNWARPILMGNSITFFVFMRVQLSKEKARQQTLIIIREMSFNASTLSSLVQVFNPN